MKQRMCNVWQTLLLISSLFWCFSSSEKSLEEEKYGVLYASPCEVCKLVTKEIGRQLEETDSSGSIEMGYNIDSKSKRKTKYNKSELRLVEVLDEVCKGMLDYRIHKERKDSTRWAKAMSQTFQTLHGLVNKGVKVDLGIPFELWDEPSAEVAHLKTQCEGFLEDQEELINDWYFGTQDKQLQSVVCAAVLADATCLSEPYGENVAQNSPSEMENQKGDITKDEL